MKSYIVWENTLFSSSFKFILKDYPFVVFIYCFLFAVYISVCLSSREDTKFGNAKRKKNNRVPGGGTARRPSKHPLLCMSVECPVCLCPSICQSPPVLWFRQGADTDYFPGGGGKIFSWRRSDFAFLYTAKVVSFNICLAGRGYMTGDPFLIYMPLDSWLNMVPWICINIFVGPHPARLITNF